jgi:hypothetical protein
MSAGIPIHCTECPAPLHAHNLTGLCAECKLVARNRRMSGQPADGCDPVTEAEALSTLADILGARPLGDTS